MARHNLCSNVQAVSCLFSPNTCCNSNALAPFFCKARKLPKEDFWREVEKELTGRETEPWEIIYFKLYQSQMPVVEKAIETAALMLGTDKSRG
ncbi:hypothetical protein SBA1_1180014 [Candidatus Sulfotelmatobacter kueseliae]|uniref:Uncharacterized protein n=1 Tax=Candidatus Sulfotelmatobacter kueseliae TaxID=2042962 RepID=A0A2U3K1H2_9BACT|nr:hypothetical protein SBA1_1180014 [Candidatus Sulfotelmatobacter kueseliae]